MGGRLFKSCSRCGKVHAKEFKCKHNAPKYRYPRAKGTEIRGTNAWAKKAEEIKESCNYLCEVCLDKGAYTYKDLSVHHIIKLREAPERALDNYNLVTLCRFHHQLADSGGLETEYLTRLSATREGKNIPPTAEICVL